MSWQSVFRSIPAIYGTIMIIVITCIFTRGFTNISMNLIDKLRSFDYLRTYVELYFIIVADAFLCIFYTFIFRLKRSLCLKYSPRLRLILLIFQFLIYVYSLSKFIIFYEWTNVRNTTSPYQLDRFDVLAIAFIPLFSMGGIFIWIIFFRINNKHTEQTTDPERQQLINETRTRLYTEETDPLAVEGKKIYHIK